MIDPTAADTNLPGIAADDQGVIALIAGWRETSFAKAESMRAAGSDRASVESQIDAMAGSQSLAIRAATSYVPFVSNPQPRDQFCRQHGRG